MTRILIHNGKLITPGTSSPETGYVFILGKQIADIGRGAPPEALQATRIDAGGGYVGPGFVDVHGHGAAGHDAMDATPEALRGIAQFKAQHGVTGFLSTTMTDTPEAINDALANVGACEGEVEGGAAILGAHVEGPYFNPAKRGAQPETYIRRADPAEYERWFDLCTVKVVSIAVEYPEHLPAIAYFRRQGAAVSAGHTDATYEQVINAIPWGLNHVTHTFNGMSGLHHRVPGVALAALTQDELYAELVCDLHHVHPAMIDLAVRNATPQRAVLITDAIRATGLPDGEYALGKQRAIVKDGLPRTPEGSIAGSSLTVDRAVRNVMHVANLALVDAWRMASLTPAESIGVDAQTGSLAINKDADITILDEALNVALTMVKGKIVYKR